MPGKFYFYSINFFLSFFTEETFEISCVPD